MTQATTPFSRAAAGEAHAGGMAEPQQRRFRPVLAALAGRRFPLEDEKATQTAIGDALVEALGADWVFREHRIVGGTIDFVVVDHPGPGVIGIEVKLKGPAPAIRRQLAAYADEPSIAALVLVTAKPMALPAAIGGKPLAVVDLGRAWL